MMIFVINKNHHRHHPVQTLVLILLEFVYNKNHHRHHPVQTLVLILLEFDLHIHSYTGSAVIRPSWRCFKPCTDKMDQLTLLIVSTHVFV